MNQNNYPVASPINIESVLHNAYACWNAGQAMQTEQLCMKVLRVVPYQPDALHLLGLIAHACGRLELAIDYLRKACAFAEVPAAYCSNLAEMCRQKGLLAEAEQFARRALVRDPQLIAAWSNLGVILQESGKFEASLDCLQRVIALQPDNHEAYNNLGNTCKRLGQLDQAQAYYQQALALRPDYAEVLSNLAVLWSDLGRFDEAVAAARQAIEINPRLLDVYCNLAQIEIFRLRYADAQRWIDALISLAPQYPGALTARTQLLIKGGYHQEALVCARQAFSAAPDNANANNLLGQVLQLLGRHDEAMEYFDRAAALPGTVAEEAMVARAALLMEIGNNEAAIAAFGHALERFPGSTRVMTARCDSKHYRSNDPDIVAMEAALVHANRLPLGEQLNLHFALGKAYLDIDNAERAFFHLDRGNAIKRNTFRYDAAKVSAWLRQIATAFSPAQMEKFRDAGAPSTHSERSVFILGMPRSGTTLVEQILASHPAIHGAGELNALRHAVSRAGTFPDDLSRWGKEELAQIGRDYLAQVDLLAPEALRLVDKMPGNFLYAGLIPLIFSGARIIHCRRDPVDTCLSCYSKHFVGEQPFAYRLDELGTFHRDYQDLMESLRRVLPPERFLEIDYEDVVDDLETQARRLITFVDLPWDQACLDFHQTRRVVRSASVSQVRQPIYTTSKGRWRRHASFLGPLFDALGVAGDASAKPTSKDCLVAESA